MRRAPYGAKIGRSSHVQIIIVKLSSSLLIHSSASNNARKSRLSQSNDLACQPGYAAGPRYLSFLCNRTSMNEHSRRISQSSLQDRTALSCWLLRCSADFSRSLQTHCKGLLGDVISLLPPLCAPASHDVSQQVSLHYQCRDYQLNCSRAIQQATVNLIQHHHPHVWGT